MIARTFVSSKNLSFIKSKNSRMPLLTLKQVSPCTYLGLWKIEQTAQAMLDSLPDEFDKNDFSPIRSEQAARQSLASRHLIWQMHKELALPFSGIYKDEFRKPFLVGSANGLGISHSSHYAVAAIRMGQQIGLDVQENIPKVSRIAPRFLSMEEMENANQRPEGHVILWAAKEALYKLDGKKGLDFKGQIEVSFVGKHQLLGRIYREGIEPLEVWLSYYFIENHVCVFTEPLQTLSPSSLIIP